MNRGSKRVSGIGSPAGSCAPAEPAPAMTATAIKVTVDQRKHSLCMGVYTPAAGEKVNREARGWMAQAAVLPSLAPTFPLTGRLWIGYCIMFHDIRRFWGRVGVIW